MLHVTSNTWFQARIVRRRARHAQVPGSAPKPMSLIDHVDFTHVPCAGERGMPKYQVLRRLGLGAKKVGKNTVEGIMTRYAVSEEDGQEGRMHIKARPVSRGACREKAHCMLLWQFSPLKKTWLPIRV